MSAVAADGRLSASEGRARAGRGPDEGRAGAGRGRAVGNLLRYHVMGERRGSRCKNNCIHTGRETTGLPVQTIIVAASLGLDGRYPHVLRHSHVK